ncbi:MAG: helix-turn-helix domain-containing protein, partial [Pseudonocardiaceae bacterium]
MGQRPKDLTPHQSLQHYWGAELRALRVARGLSLAELGHQLHCDPSYLAKIERAERPIPATLAQSCDRVLDTQGMLVRLHTLAQAASEQTTTTTDRSPAHVASDNGHVASPPGNLAGGTTFPTAPDTDEEIVARTPDGRVVFVSVPRRVFIRGISSAAIGLTTAPAAVPSATLLPDVGDVHPIEHFRQLRQVLIENDMLFGPRQVIPIVRRQIAIMQQLRSSWRGADQRELVRTQALYTQFHGWLYKDTGENH